ncbi:hypothetical protein P8452_65113 [Trifolium repens]|nr:hypothetical protein P8452_65113 [Trifolium repens]
MVNGTVAISNNVVQAIVTGPLYDRSPVAVYAVSKLLMPRELPHPTPMSSDASAKSKIITKLSEHSNTCK